MVRVAHIKSLMYREARSKVPFLDHWDLLVDLLDDLRVPLRRQEVTLLDVQQRIVTVVFRDQAWEVQG